MTLFTQVDEESLSLLSQVGAKTTLRFAVQLLTPAAITAKLAGRTNINPDDIRDMGRLFLDAKQSAKKLKDNQDKYMY